MAREVNRPETGYGSALDIRDSTKTIVGVTFGVVYKQKYDAQRLVEEITEYAVGEFRDPSMKSMARRVVAITNRVTNSPELNNNSLKEGLLEKMMGMARGDEYIQAARGQQGHHFRLQ